MIYREAKIEDIPGIQLVRNSVKENMLSDPLLVTDEDCRIYITERGKGWVAEENNRIVGFAIADLKEDNIWALFIHPDFERRGIGKKLHDEMLNWYFSQTDKTVWLGTSQKTRAELFYRKAGWKEVGLHGKDEIKFEIPGIRTEHILVGEKHEVISITVLTPINENQTELTHIFYSSLPLTKWLWWPLKRLGKQFIGQDLGVFNKLSEGLKSKPTLMLIGEPDMQARWYYEIKRLWALSQQNNVPFENPVKPQTLHWVT